MLRIEKVKGKSGERARKSISHCWVKTAQTARKAKRTKPSFLIFAFCLLPFALFSLACRQDMQDQPKYTPLRPSAFFADGQSQRPLVEGVVPRRDIREYLDQDSGDSSGGRSLRPGAESSSQLT